MPAEDLVSLIADEVKALAGGEPLEAIGVATPGIIRLGSIEDSPNFQQLKGFDMQCGVMDALAARGIQAQIAVSNDADVVASGIAARHGKLDQLVRAWTLGNGIGFGRYPAIPGVWEGGHMVVTLDPSERFCGCGGIGHLESIMGNRAMRLRFLDMEPEEVFAAAKRLIIQPSPVKNGSACQISLAYSAMVRSLENLPDAAMFRITLRVHAGWSAYNSPSR